MTQDDVSRETPDEMEVIASTRIRVVECRGESVEVKPLTIGQLPRFVKAVRPLLVVHADTIAADGFSLDMAVGMVESHADQLVAAIAVATGRPAAWINETTLDEFTELATAVFAVNLDFFVRRLLPSLARNVTDLAGHIPELNGSGRTPSSSSSEPATH
jgi:hypothetical protein